MKGGREICLCTDGSALIFGDMEGGVEKYNGDSSNIGPQMCMCE